MLFTLYEILRYHPVIKFHDSIIGPLVLPSVSQHQDRVLCYLYLISAITKSGDSAGSYLHHLSLEAMPSTRPAVRTGASTRTGPWPAFRGACDKEKRTPGTQANSRVGGC